MNTRKSLTHFALLLLTSLFFWHIGPVAAQTGPASLDIPDNIQAATNSTGVAPINLTTNGHPVTAITFSIDFDETALTFDPNATDAVKFNLPNGYTSQFTYDASDTDGELDIVIFTLSNPATPLADAEIAQVTFGTGAAGQAAVNFSNSPAISFAGAGGLNIPGGSDGNGGSFAVGNAVVVDFSCTPRSGTAPLEVTCTNESTGDVSGWLWKINDQTVGTAQTLPAQTMTVDGSYTVSLTATPANGTADVTKTRTNYINVGDATGNVILPIKSIGELSVTMQPVVFPETGLAGEDVLAYAIDTAWEAADKTNLGAGWSVMLGAAGNFEGDETGRSIPIGTEHDFKVGCTDSEITVTSGDADNKPVCSSVLPIPNTGNGEAALTLISAEKFAGMGVYGFTPHFQLRIPGNTVIDTYRATIHVDIVAGP